MPRAGVVDNFGPRHPGPSMMVPMPDPVRTIAERVRTRVLRDGVDLAGDERGVSSEPRADPGGGGGGWDAAPAHGAARHQRGRDYA